MKREFAEGSAGRGLRQPAAAVAASAMMAMVVLLPVPKAGSSKVNPKDGLTYVWIPAGTFVMGCSPGDRECGAEEKPAHRVTITKGFWMGQTEVTQAAFERAVGYNPSHTKGDSLPVQNIAWAQARDYCEAAGMRLATEAEWEYAARGGASSARYDTPDEVAWHARTSGGHAHAGGLKRANAYGLYDMLGTCGSGWTAASALIERMR